MEGVEHVDADTAVDEKYMARGRMSSWGMDKLGRYCFSVLSHKNKRRRRRTQKYNIACDGNIEFQEMGIPRLVLFLCFVIKNKKRIQKDVMDGREMSSLREWVY